MNTLHPLPGNEAASPPSIRLEEILKVYFPFLVAQPLPELSAAAGPHDRSFEPEDAYLSSEL